GGRVWRGALKFSPPAWGLLPPPPPAGPPLPGDRLWADRGLYAGWLRQDDHAGGLGPAQPRAGRVAVAGRGGQRPRAILAVRGGGAGRGAAGDRCPGHGAAARSAAATARGGGHRRDQRAEP